MLHCGVVQFSSFVLFGTPLGALNKLGSEFLIDTFFCVAAGDALCRDDTGGGGGAAS